VNTSHFINTLQLSSGLREFLFNNGHILKRIWKHTREGGPEDMDLQGFDEAMRDSKSGLTYAALTGQRKQSVQDAERMLSFLVSDFLEEKGYNREASYVKIVAGASYSY